MFAKFVTPLRGGSPRQHSQKSILRFASLGLAFSLAVLAPLAASANDAAAGNASGQPLKVLHIGNSFSNDATTYLPELAKAGGKDLLVAGATIGGCTLERHARHLAEAKAGDPKGSAYTTNYARHKALNLKTGRGTFTLPEALEAQEWNVVTIQQASPMSFRPESYEPHAEQLITEIREKAPNATILIHQTWPYRPDHPLLARENMTPDIMYERIVDAYTQFGKRYNLGFLPSGNAVHTATKTDEWAYAPDPNFDYKNPPENTKPDEKGLYPGYSWRTRDGKRSFALDAIHMNAAGDYLTGCVWYEILFNDSVLDVDFVPKELTSEQAAQLRRIAHDTVAAYKAKGAL